MTDSPDERAEARGDKDASLVRLSIFCPIRPGGQSQGGSGSRNDDGAVQAAKVLEVPAALSVGELKARLETEVQGGPLKNAQTLIWRGRRLLDQEKLGVLTNELEGVSAAGMTLKGRHSGQA